MTKVIKVPESHLEVISSPQQDFQPTALSQLKYAEPTELYLRDGDVVLFRRPNSPLWQCRYKRQNITTAEPQSFSSTKQINQSR